MSIPPRIQYGSSDPKITQYTNAAQQPSEQLFLLLSVTFQNLDIITFIEQMFQENAISYRFSDRVYQNSMLWLQAKSYIQKDEDIEIQELVQQQQTQPNF